MSHKPCKKCGVTKPLTDFYAHKLYAGGYRPQCKPCMNQLNSTVWKNKQPIKKKPLTEEQKEKYKARRRVANRDASYAQAQKDWRNRYFSDPQKNLARAIRRRLYMARKAECKTGKTLDHLGCSWAELKIHLEKQFQPGMNWDNYGQGGWHIDHIQPLCAFDLTKEEHLKIACHYSNLRPLWQHENIAKIQEDIKYSKKW